MRSRSLRVRLLGLAAATIGAALALAWLALTLLFERHVASRVDAELANGITGIAASLDIVGEDAALRSEPADPRFDLPFSGSYWQVEVAGMEPLRSRSLWDESLPPPPEPAGGSQSYRATGPKGEALILRAETLQIPSSAGERTARIILASDAKEIADATSSYGSDLAIALVVIGACLTGAAALQVGIGLAPLSSLRREIFEIRARRRQRLEGIFPREVQPLLEELNALLAAQGEALARARTRASDLAHGLKTPLSILSAVGRDLERAGRTADAAEIRTQIEMISRRIDRQLARARLGTDNPSTSRIGELAERLIAVLARSPRGAALRWDIEFDEDFVVAADDVDVAEAVGNVLDNAGKWARSVVRVTLTGSDGSVVFKVEDDGRGVPEERLAELGAHGRRLDADAEGAGLGLAIVTDILAAYGGALEITRSALGGLAVALAWPSAPRGKAATAKPGRERPEETGAQVAGQT